MKRTLLLFASLLCALVTLAQDGKIRGQVTDEKGEPLYGVNVYIDGTTTGVSTGFDGEFNLSAPPGATTIVFSYVGMEEIKRNVTVEAGKTSSIEVEMSESVEMMQLVVVSDNKYEKSANEVTVSIEVIKPDKIVNTNNTLEESLNRISGMNMVGETPQIRGGAGFSSTASSRVLVLLDGIPFNSPDNGGVRWNALPMENLKQIELIKGASSSLYGSAAMSGVLNIITENPTEEPYTKLFLNYGLFQKPSKKIYAAKWSENNHKPFFGTGRFIHKRRFGKVGISMGGAYTQDNSYLLYNDQKTARANLKVSHISEKIEGLTVGVAANFFHRTGHEYFIWDDISGDLSNIFLASDTVLVRERAFNVAPYVTLYDKKDNRHGLKTQYYNTYFFNFGPEFSTNHQFYWEYLFTHRNAQRKMTLNTGTSGSFTTTNGATFGEHINRNVAVFAQVDKKLTKRESLNLTFGARLEYFRTDRGANAIESRVNPNPFDNNDSTGGIPVVPLLRVGLNYQLFEGTFIRGSFGQGYRFPNLAELHIDVTRSGFPTRGNVDLNPEKNWSSELGIRQAFQIGSGKKAWFGYADFAGFVTRYYDLIEINFGFDQQTQSQFVQFQNVDNARISGMEASLYSEGILLGVPLSIQAGYTFLQPINLDFESPVAVLGPFTKYLKYRRRHSAKADIEAAWIMENENELSFGLTFFYLSANLEKDGPFALQNGIGAYYDANNNGEFFLDGRARYKFNEHSEVSFICKNITNSEYSLRLGKLEPPRNFTFQYAYTF